MIRLDLGREPEWLELGHGAALLLDPPTSTVMMIARSDPALSAADAAALAPADGDAARSHGPEAVRFTIAFAKALARAAARDWRGVGDAEGAEVAMTPEGLDALLDLHWAFDAFSAGYMARAMLVVQEKNA
jgi:hypothetical protein